MQQLQTPSESYNSETSHLDNDFISDHQPPQDFTQQRKLLYKQDNLYVRKTIIALGYDMDRPARYDKIKLRWVKLKPQDPKKKITFSHAQADELLNDEPIQQYNLGTKNYQIQRLVTSMRRKQLSLFEKQYVRPGVSTNNKVLGNRQSYLIQALDWVTVIDLEGDKNLLKYMLKKGIGHSRVKLYDEVSYRLTMQSDGKILSQDFENVILQKNVMQKIPKLIWLVLSSMKVHEEASIEISEKIIKSRQSTQSFEEYLKFLSLSQQENNNRLWNITIQVTSLYTIDDIHMDGSILKKKIIHGTSSARPQGGCKIYYALEFLDNNSKRFYADKLFDETEIPEQIDKLQKIQGIRINYLDDYTISKALKYVFERMKPGQYSQFQCRKLEFFTFGSDFVDYKRQAQANNIDIKQSIKIGVKIFNFTEELASYSMTLSQKIQEAKRLMKIANMLIQSKQHARAIKKLQRITRFFNNSDLVQEAYDLKIDAIMKMIQQKLIQGDYDDILDLCDEVLNQPKKKVQQFGFVIKLPESMTISINSGQSSTEHKVNTLSFDSQPATKEISVFQQQSDKELAMIKNPTIIEQCKFFKAVMLYELGNVEQAQELVNSLQKKDSVKIGFLKMKIQQKLGSKKKQQ